MGLQGIGGGVEGFTRGRGGGGVGGERDERRQDRVTDWLEPKRDATCLRDWDLCESENARRDGVRTCPRRPFTDVGWLRFLSFSFARRFSLDLLYRDKQPPRRTAAKGWNDFVLIQDDPAWVLTLEDYLLWEATLLLFPSGFSTPCRIEAKA